MTHNTYTVTTPDGDVEVKGLGAYHDRDALIIYTDAERQHVAAVFRRWEHVTVAAAQEPTDPLPGWAESLRRAFASDLSNPQSADGVRELVLRAATKGFEAGVEAARQTFARGYADGRAAARETQA